MATPTAQSLGITFSQGAQATPAGVANAQATGMYSNTPGYSSAPTAAEITNRPNNTTSAPAVTPPPVPTPDLTVPTPTPTVNLNPDNSGVVASNLTQAFNTVKNTPPPQNAGDAASAITTATNQAAQTPTFYKPDPNSQQVYNAQGQAVSHDQYLAQGGKADYSNVQNAAVPVKQMTPVSLVDQTLANDKGYQQLQKDYTDYQNTVNQGKSLLDTYNSLTKSLGLDSINTELINTEKIINGTQQNIRDEVTAAGGFATDSQVLAMSDARNKTLVQNYNTLVAQQKNVTDQINNMMTLSESDRNYALQTAQNKLNIDGQMLDYQQKFTAAATEGYQNIANTVGYNGLYNALMNSDPTGQRLNEAEQLMKMPPGTIKSIAATEQQQAVFQNQMNQLDLKAKQASINASNTSTAKTASELSFMNAHDGMTPAEVQAQNQAVATAHDAIYSDASNLIAKLADPKNPITWQDAYAQLKTKYYPGDNSQETANTIDQLLQANNFRPASSNPATSTPPQQATIPTVNSGYTPPNIPGIPTNYSK